MSAKIGWKNTKGKEQKLILFEKEVHLKVGVDSFDQNMIDMVTRDSYKIIDYDPIKKIVTYKKKLKNSYQRESVAKIAVIMKFERY